MINKLLKKKSESRKRQLRIRTYTVLPLNEECGLLEWVNDTHAYRNILVEIYRAKNMYTRGQEIKNLLPNKGTSTELVPLVGKRFMALGLLSTC